MNLIDYYLFILLAQPGRQSYVPAVLSARGVQLSFNKCWHFCPFIRDMRQSKSS